MHSSRDARFPSTAWDMIRLAQGPRDAQWRDATNRFVSAYWKPVFYFVRAKGHALHRAEELTQEFFLEFFSRGWIRPADQNRGRFRTFLLTVLTRFLSDQGPQRQRRQQTFDDEMVDVSTLRAESGSAIDPPDHRTPEELFMREWARAVMASVHMSLEIWCFARGRPEWYGVFREMYFPDNENQQITQQGLAERLDLTRDKVRYALAEVHRQFRALLRAEVAEQIGPAGDVDAEIRELEALLAKA